MFNQDMGVYVGIFSKQRSGNVAKMEGLVGPATWYVPVGEAEEYERAGACAVIESGGLCESRNAVLRDAFSVGQTAVQLSDDLEGINYASGANKKSPILFGQCVLLSKTRLDASNYFMAGAAPTDNAYFFNPDRRVTEAAFVVGDYLMLKPCELFFDEALKLKEDYDYTAQHIKAYGGVVRSNDLLLSFKHRSNPGGAVADRTADLEQKSIAYLMAKWPDIFRPNAKRENEILMNAKRLIRNADQPLETAVV